MEKLEGLGQNNNGDLLSPSKKQLIGGRPICVKLFLVPFCYISFAIHLKPIQQSSGKVLIHWTSSSRKVLPYSLSIMHYYLVNIFLFLACVKVSTALVRSDVEDFLYGGPSKQARGPSRFSSGPVRQSATELQSIDGGDKPEGRITKRDARFFVGSGGTFEVGYF